MILWKYSYHPIESMKIFLTIQLNDAVYNPGLFRNILLSDGFVESNGSTIIPFLSSDEHICGTLKINSHIDQGTCGCLWCGKKRLCNSICKGIQQCKSLWHVMKSSSWIVSPSWKVHMSILLASTVSCAAATIGGPVGPLIIFFWKFFSCGPSKILMVLWSDGTSQISPRQFLTSPPPSTPSQSSPIRRSLREDICPLARWVGKLSEC